MSLKELIEGASIAEIGAALDAMSAAKRLEATRSLGRGAQRLLFEKAGDAEPLTLEDFVPAALGPLREVIHDGRNTLPAFRLFQKRFCRTEDSPDVLYGYNEGATRSLIGPGCFLAYETAGKDPAWPAIGSVVVDYHEVPKGQVVAGWPQVVPNEQGLQKFVYAKTRDFMRRVSTHVTIGAAYKKGKPLNAWFVLCRQED